MIPIFVMFLRLAPSPASKRVISRRPIKVFMFVFLAVSAKRKLTKDKKKYYVRVFVPQ